MERRQHSLALLGLGFAAGATMVALIGGLPGLPEPQPPQATTAVAAAAPASYADAVAAAAPAVVNVYGHVGVAGPPPPDHRFDGRGRPGTSLGCGVLVSADGLIVTNAHVVRGADAIQVGLANGPLLDAGLLGIDAETDLAVLRAPVADGGLVPIALGDPEALAIGDVVLAIGNPFGIGRTVSLGIVSATGRTHLGLTDIERFIQTDAAINPGSSGGALIDAAGRLVGINTAILSESGRSEGVGFAIPVDLAMGVVDQIARSGAVRRGWIGIGGRSLTPQLAARYGLRAPHGVLVSSVAEDGPADAAGLRPGDVITRADDLDLDSSLALRERIMAKPPGSRLTLELWRGSERLRTEVATAGRPPGGIQRSSAAARHARLGPGGRVCGGSDC